MTRYGLEDSDDFWECPECGAVFAWHDDTSFTGSGNNDEETLTRLGVDDAATIRTLAHRDSDLSDAELEALGAGVVAARPAIRALMTALVRRNMKIAQRLVPFWLDCTGRNPWVIELLESLVTTPDEAAHVRPLLDRYEGEHLGTLRGHVRTVGCSICRGIPHYPPLETARAPQLAAMRRFGEGGHDVRECTECGSLFEIDGRGAKRIHEAFARALRECFRAAVVSPAALTIVKNGGADWRWVREHVEQRARRGPRGLVEPPSSSPGEPPVDQDPLVARITKGK
jgi:hypothetical protein